ncbi:MAG: TonB-dependent receptor [Gammaproteobacteria bacterium]|nr:MAG: TonB-dependent receptor [Gammaproteobacteria bacterium]
MNTSRLTRLQNISQTSTTSSQPFKRKLIATAVGFVISASFASFNTYAAEKNEQEKDDVTALEIVVVTSRNRAEAAQDIPLPVRVIGGERLDREDIKSIWDLPYVAPNLQLNNPGENARKVSPGIRGLGRGGANDSMEQSVGTIVDGVTLYYSGQAWADYVDLDRVEVLYGPQGTLVGKNTSLGAIKISTKAPSFTPSSTFEVTAGDLNTLQAKVSTTGPLIDDLLAYRGTFLVDRKDGLYDNTYLNFGKSRETFRESNKIAGRIQFLLTPNEDFTGRFIFDKLRSDERTNTGNVLVSNGPDTWADGTARAQTTPITADTGYTVNTDTPFATYGYLGKFAERAAWFHNADGTVYQPPLGTTDIENSEARPQITNQYGGSAQFDWHVQNHTLTSITAYRYQDFDIKNGGQFGQFYVSNSGQQLWNDQFSQELRITSDTDPDKFFDYQAGLYYLNAEVYSDDPSYYGADAGAWFAKSAQYKTLVANTTPSLRAAGRQLLQASLNNVYQSSVTDATVNSLAAYAQADFHLTDRATISVGVRDTDETKKNKIATQLDRPGENLQALGAQYGATAAQITAAQTVRAGQVPIAPFDFVNGNDVNDNLVAWNISPSYKITDDINVYASVGKGVKSGFIYFTQYVAPTDPTFETDVKPEETLDYELGFKSLLLNRTLQLNFNLYDTKVSDYQASWTRTDPRNDGAFITAWGNAPKVEAKGVELESNYRFNKSLDFNLGAAYNEATYESEWLVLKPEVVANGNRNDFIDRNGKQIANVPKVVINYGLNYQREIAGYLGRVTLQNSYKSGAYFNDNQAEFTYQKAFNVTNVSFAFGSLDEKWEARLNIRNVFDTEYAVRRATYTSTAGQTLEIGEPRYTTVTLKYNL